MYCADINVCGVHIPNVLMNSSYDNNNASFKIEHGNIKKNDDLLSFNENWSTGLCDCCDGSGTCCCACILPCVILAQNVHYMQQLGISSIPFVDDCECSFCSKPLTAGVLYGLGMAAYFAGVVLAPCHPYWSNLGWLECGSIGLHASIRTVIYEATVLNYDYQDILDNDGSTHNCCASFCCALCCYSCALAQEQRQLLQGLRSTPNSMVL